MVIIVPKQKLYIGRYSMRGQGIGQGKMQIVFGSLFEY